MLQDYLCEEDLKNGREENDEREGKENEHTHFYEGEIWACVFIVSSFLNLSS